MPLTPSKRVVLVEHSSYCSAPPLISSHLPPRLSRAEEARRPRAPLRTIKAEVRESEADSADFTFKDEDVNVDVKPVIVPDPRHLSARVAAISIRQPESGGEDRHASFRTQPLCRVPSSQLGPGDPPIRPGRPKGSKSRPKIAPVPDLPTPPVRAAAAKARSGMTSTSNRS